MRQADVFFSIDNTGSMEGETANIQFIVDANRGEIVQAVPFMKSADWGWGTDPRLIRYDARRLAGIDREGKIVWWDPRTGRVEHPPRR